MSNSFQSGNSQPGAPSDAIAEMIKADVAARSANEATPRWLAEVQNIRIALVVAAYGGQEKRASAYGYIAQLNALVALKKATEDQKADLQTLIDAAEWEQQMLEFAAALKPGDDLSASAWPKPPSALADLVDDPMGL